jgi:RimJ/RimL family protein N-acetyltransferase
MVAVLGDPELYRYTGGEPPSETDLKARYANQVTGSEVRGESWLNWIVRLAGSQRPVGFVQATVNASGAELAWVIAVGEQGRGNASEAASAMASWLRNKGVETFDAHIHPLNSASIRVATSLGMTDTGAVDDIGEHIFSTSAGKGL